MQSLGSRAECVDTAASLWESSPGLAQGDPGCPGRGRCVEKGVFGPEAGACVTLGTHVCVGVGDLCPGPSGDLGLISTFMSGQQMAEPGVTVF